MRKYLFLLLLTYSGLHAQVTMEDLMLEIQQLKKEVKVLKQQQNINTDSLDEISEFTEEVETKVITNKIDFGLGFQTNLDFFDKSYADKHSVKNEAVWSNKLMLNMKADIYDNMNFYGRLSMYKYWGSSNIHPYTYYDNMQGRVPSDSAIYVERAYINWFLNKDSYIPVALTLGRQPSSDGPSSQYKNDSARKGTYSALLYDGAADGIVLTANISKLIEIDNSFLRFGYAKGFGYSETSSTAGNAFVGASNNDIKDTNVFGVFLDTTIPTVENSLVQISYSRMKDIVANPLDNNSSQNINIGDVDLFGAMLEVSNFNNTKIDIFAHFGHSVAHPNSNSYQNYGGLLSSNGDTTSKSGDSIWLGSRYSFGHKKKYKVGFEYNYGSKNWINLTQGSFDVYNKLSTRGNAYETYLSYSINRYANIRLGHIYIDYEYTGSGWFVGESKKINSSLNDANSVVEQLQSTYLKMNINY